MEANEIIERLKNVKRYNIWASDDAEIHDDGDWAKHEHIAQIISDYEREMLKKKIAVLTHVFSVSKLSFSFAKIFNETPSQKFLDMEVLHIEMLEKLKDPNITIESIDNMLEKMQELASKENY